MELDKQKCAEAGMDDHIPNPIKPKVMIERMAGWIRVNS